MSGDHLAAIHAAWTTGPVKHGTISGVLQFARPRELDAIHLVHRTQVFGTVVETKSFATWAASLTQLPNRHATCTTSMYVVINHCDLGC